VAEPDIQKMEKYKKISTVDKQRIHICIWKSAHVGNKYETTAGKEVH
jgi:hypothetical protein